MKKTLIILLCSICAIVIILLLFVNRNDTSYIIFDNSLFLSFDNGIFKEVSSDDLFKKDYHAFYQKEYIGKYELYNIDSEYGRLFFSNSKSKDTYSFETPYLAITSGMEFVSFEVVDGVVEDLSYLTYDLDKYWLENVEELDVFKKVLFDVDNDGSDESIYYASYCNLLDDDFDLEKSFSVVFMVDNNKVYVLEETNPYDAYVDEEDSFYTMDNLVLEYLLKSNKSIFMVVSTKSTDLSFYSIYEFTGDDLICKYS